MTYTLNNQNIDLASEKATEFLSKAGVDSKEILRIRLSLEEILLKYLEIYGDKKSFKFKMTKTLRALRLELSIAGISIDPFSGEDEDDSIVLHNLLANFGLAPSWIYKNGQNIITFTARKKKRSTVAQLGIAFALALVCGSLCQILPEPAAHFMVDDLVSPLFDTFMGLLSAIAGPIIFLSVVWGICGIGDMSTFGKIGKKMIQRFLIISTLTGIIATCICGLFFKISTAGETAFAFSDLYQMILDIIPNNFFAPFVEGNSLQIIFIAIIVGLSMLILGNRIPFVFALIEQLNSLIQLIMSGLSSFLSFFVFASIFKMIAGGSLGLIAQSYKSVIVMLLLEAILMVCYLITVSARKKVSPIQLFNKLMPTFIIGLSTASSIAAYSTNIATCEKKLGIPKKIIDFGVPLGQVIFMPGALIQFLASAFGMAETFDIAITPLWMVTACIICIVLAIAAPPVPGATLTCFTILFLQLNIPAAAIAIVVTLNVILEFVATAVNLFCLQTELIELSGSLNLLNSEILHN